MTSLQVAICDDVKRAQTPCHSRISNEKPKKKLYTSSNTLRNAFNTHKCDDGECITQPLLVKLRQGNKEPIIFAGNNTLRKKRCFFDFIRF